MDWITEAALFAVGIAGGFISAVAGGANVVTFPTLQWAGVASTVVATATNSVALIPGNPLAAYKDWSKRPPFDVSLLVLLVASVVWGALGAKLLLVTPEALFRLLVPGLLGLATLMFVYSARIGAWLRQKANRLASLLTAGSRDEVNPSVLRVLLYIPIAMYGGFFGAGLGILVLAVLSIGRSADLRTLNVEKNIVCAVTTLAASSMFIWDKAVSWPHAAWMLPGVAIGGMAAGWYSKIVSAEKLRATVISIGCVVTIVYAWRFWT